MPRVQAHKLARLALFGFIVTFIIARACVLLIMSRQMPNLYLFMQGTHVHHLNYGIFLLAVVPQFIDPARGCVLTQALMLGAAQISVSVTVNAAIAGAAGGIAGFLARRPGWSTVQRWLMATVLGSLALRMATEARR